MDSLESYLYHDTENLLSEDGQRMFQVYGEATGLKTAANCDLRAYHTHFTAVHLQLQGGALMRVVGGMPTLQKDLVGVFRVHVPIEAALESSSSGNEIRTLKEDYGRAYGSSSGDGIGKMAELFMRNLAVTPLRQMHDSLTEHFTAVWLGQQKSMSHKPCIFMDANSADYETVNHSHYTAALVSAISDCGEVISETVRKFILQVDVTMAESAARAFANTLAGRPVPDSQDGLDYFELAMLVVAKQAQLRPMVSHIVDMHKIVATNGHTSSVTQGAQKLKHYVDQYGLYVSEDRRPIYINWKATR